MDRLSGPGTCRHQPQTPHAGRRLHRTDRKENPRMKPYLALIKIDLKLAMRNRTVLFFNWLFPLIFFFIFAQSSHAEQGGAITEIVAMVATIGVIGNGLFGAGMRAAQERENNTLRRYKVTPIGPLPLLVS